MLKPLGFNVFESWNSTLWKSGEAYHPTIGLDPRFFWGGGGGLTNRRFRIPIQNRCTLPDKKRAKAQKGRAKRPPEIFVFVWRRRAQKLARDFIFQGRRANRFLRLIISDLVFAIYFPWLNFVKLVEPKPIPNDRRRPRGIPIDSGHNPFFAHSHSLFSTWSYNPTIQSSIHTRPRTDLATSVLGCTSKGEASPRDIVSKMNTAKDEGRNHLPSY